MFSHHQQMDRHTSLSAHTTLLGKSIPLEQKDYYIDNITGSLIILSLVVHSLIMSNDMYYATKIWVHTLESKRFMIGHQLTSG